jgi:3-isopropylmalate dehydrogenase
VPGDDIDTDRIIPARYLKVRHLRRPRRVPVPRRPLRRRRPQHRAPARRPAPKRRDRSWCRAATSAAAPRASTPRRRSDARRLRGRRGESFAEIFFGNSTTLGLVCLALEPADLAAVAAAVDADPSAEIRVDVATVAVEVAGRRYPGRAPGDAPAAPSSAAATTPWPSSSPTTRRSPRRPRASRTWRRRRERTRRHRIAVLAGDFIGPEVIDATLEVLAPSRRAPASRSTSSRSRSAGTPSTLHGTPLPEVTKAVLAEADAVLMGASGGPVGDHPWNRLPRELRVESGILGLRRHLGAYANLRPVAVFEGLEHLSPLKPEIARGTDMLIVRELTGGIYFGKPSQNGPDRGVSTDVYERHEVERIARTAFEPPGSAAVASRTSTRPTSSTSRSSGATSWSRSTRRAMPTSRSTTSTSTTPPCSSCATRAPSTSSSPQPVRRHPLRPGRRAARLARRPPVGQPRRSGRPVRARPRQRPRHRRAGIANPTGTLLSAAMMLRYGLAAPDAADALERAVRAALAEDPTRDLGGNRGTAEFTAAVVAALPSRIGTDAAPA